MILESVISDDSGAQPLTTTGARDRPGSKLTELLDIRFERRAAPMLVRWLYVGSLVLVVSVTLFAMLMSWWLASWAGWGFWMGIPISIASGLVWALTARLACEGLIHWTKP